MKNIYLRIENSNIKFNSKFHDNFKIQTIPLKKSQTIYTVFYSFGIYLCLFHSMKYLWILFSLKFSWSENFNRKSIPKCTFKNTFKNFLVFCWTCDVILEQREASTLIKVPKFIKNQLKKKKWKTRTRICVLLKRNTFFARLSIYSLIVAIFIRIEYNFILGK